MLQPCLNRMAAGSRFLVWAILVVVPIVISCGSNKTDAPAELRMETRDSSPPELEELQPASGQKLGETPVGSISVSGKLRESGKVTAVIINNQANGQEVVAQITAMPPSFYRFEATVTLMTGENMLLLKAEDEAGNVLEQEIVYYNGEAPKLILEPERKELPIGGSMLFEVFLESSGNKQPLRSDEVELKAQSGYFQEFKYHAPGHSGTDIVSGKSTVHNSRSQIRIYIKKPQLAIECEIPAHIPQGSETKCSVTLQNKGDIESLSNKVTVKLPATVSFQKADKNGTFNNIVREIVWTLPSVAAGGSEVCNFSLEGNEIGTGEMVITALVGDEEIANMKRSSEVIGECLIAHKLNRNAVVVGEEVTCTIVLTAKHNVREIKCWYEFAEQLEFISATGQTPGGALTGSLVGNKIEFAAVAELATDQRLSLDIKWKARRIGNLQNHFNITYKTETNAVKTRADTAVLAIQ